MSVDSASPALSVLLIGNPNTGKSTLFNVLAGVRQRVGNYPGVTVEKKVGRTRIEGKAIDVIDLPGSYSLAPRSPDEMVAVDVLLGRRDDTPPADLVVCIVDAGNLERNLFLTSQVLEMGLPTVIALNMMDVARSRGIEIDTKLLGDRLGAPVVALQANRGQGVDELKQTLIRLVDQKIPTRDNPFPESFQDEVAALQKHFADTGRGETPKYLIERLLLDQSGYMFSVLEGDEATGQAIEAARARLGEQGPVSALEPIHRYQWIADVLEGAVSRPKSQPTTLSDRLDRVLTHRFWGALVFVLLMVLIFQSVFAWSGPAMDGIEWLIGRLSEAVAGWLPEGSLRSLIVDGVIAGVGGVLVFLPQIFILFFFIAVMEDCGYMARAAYLMDKLMSRIGLSGKSFIPLLSSFACAIPGVMATRVIENPRDRLVTILVAPLMSCSARLPVYTVMIAAFIPNTTWLGGWLGLQGATMFAMYMIGIVTAVLVALILKLTILKGETPPFVMELPNYKLPSPRTVAFRMLDRGWSFIRRAGTLILAVSILVWFASYFPRGPEVAKRVEADFADRIQTLQSQMDQADIDDEKKAELDAQAKELDGELQNQTAAAYIGQSYLARMGRAVEPAVKPLGWDWRIACGAIASFPAREVIIGTLGVIYSLGGDQDEESETLRERLKAANWDGSGKPVYNIPVALSIMVFFALCAQCAATLAVIKRETNSWRWPLFTFVYMTGLAYVGALAVYQIGMSLSG